MYSRKDKAPRLVTPGFEHLNNFVLFDDGRDVFIKRIDNDESLTTNLVQYTQSPLGVDSNTYTMVIKDITEGEFVMFGLTNKCVEGYPMWTIDRSLRYHSNDGGVFNGGLGIKTYHPYGVGDRVTCQLDYIGADRCLINFLKNDQLVYRQWVNLPPDQLYPTIGVSRTEAKLRVEWPRDGKKGVEIRKDVLTNWFGWSGLERDNEKMVVTLVQPDEETEREAYSLQCPVVLGQDFHYFEIEVVKKGQEEGCQGIGLVAGNCEAFVMPGWTPSSIGYHNDNGGLYYDGQDQDAESAGPEKVCGVGDRMGCGIVFPEIPQSNFREPILVLVYFTKNGKLVHKKRMRQPRGGFFPCVGFFRKGDSIKIDVNCPPPGGLKDDLIKALNLADVSADFRCSELIQFTALAPDSATFCLNTEADTPQLVQYLRYPLAHVGDGFFLKVMDLRPNTELQVGVSKNDHPMEGEFLGSNRNSCGYLLKLGSIAMKDGMRTAGKWSGPADHITCYLDYHDEKLVIVCFLNGKEELLGRATLSSQQAEDHLLGSVVLSSGPATVQLNWSRSIYNSHNLDRSWGQAEKWLRPPGIKAEKNKLTLKTTESYSFAACAQARNPMVTGSSFFSIKLLGGESLPGIGLGKATSDVNNVLGSESGEVCFLPSQGELIIQNNKWRLESPPKFKAGDILQCGMIFAEPERVEQKGVVYFCHNDKEFFHCRFHMAHGGAYPTVTFATKGCSAEVLDTSRAQPIPDRIAADWLNVDIMEGVVPYTSGDLVGPSTYDSGQNDEELQIVDSGYNERIVYVSHTIRERERVDPIIATLCKTYPNFVFETSASCVGNSAKMDTIQRSEFVIIFMSKLYSESHEMAMEFSFFSSGKPLLVAADRQMFWPPGDYFKQEQETLEQLPMVPISTVNDKEGMDNLVHAVNELFMQEAPTGKKANKKSRKRGSHVNGVMNTAVPPQAVPTLNVNDMDPKDEKSKTCSIL